jgi:hypothetical protein
VTPRGRFFEGSGGGAQETGFFKYKPKRGVVMAKPGTMRRNTPRLLSPGSKPANLRRRLNPKLINLQARKAPQRFLPATPAGVYTDEVLMDRGNDRCSKAVGAAQYEPADLIRSSIDVVSNFGMGF